MPTVPSIAKVLKNAPSLGSLLISTGPGFDECGLCGNSFDSSGSSNSTRIKLPCTDSQCEPCARMWRILSSPICLGCYADFNCPKIARHRAQISSPQLHPDGNDILQQQTPLDSHIEPLISFQDMYDAFYRAAADSENHTISRPGSPMREEDDEITAVSEFRHDDLREALIFANNRTGTNFSIQEIEDEIPLVVLRTGTKAQLADTLTQLCDQKASESDESDESDEGDESLQQPDEDDPNDATSPQDEETAQGNSFRCLYCQKDLKSAGHLRQHMVIHSIGGRTCSICGLVLANPGSRREHEKKHRETDSQRGERLRKAKVAKDELRTGQRAPNKYRSRRVPQVLE